ncbi:MAG: tetratricopeptide repeat protein [Bacteroidota bacterium]
MNHETLQAMQMALNETLLTAAEVALPAPSTPMVASDPATLPLHTLDDFTPFSQSLLWNLQRRFYEQQGAAAWSRGKVPHYVTSNSFIAQAYAQIALGYLRDLAEGGDALTVHFVELGAGSGQFSFHFLHWLIPSFVQSQLPGKVRFRYVMTDFAEENLAFWRSHAGFSAWVEQGWLDFARFDVTRDTDLSLQISGERLTAEAPAGPVLLIANYLFDTVPQDLFRIKEGDLFQSEVRLQMRGSEVPDLHDPALLPHLELRYRHVLWEGKDIYREASLNRLLGEYRDEFPECSLLFPADGLRCIERFRALSRDRLFVLSGDKGFFTEDALLGFTLPGIAHHGSFSLTVNYHAFGKYALQEGGTAWFRPQNGASITVCGFAFSGSTDLRETRLAWEQAGLRFGPDDYFTLKGGMERNFAAFSPSELLAYLRLSGYDPKALRRILPPLIQAAEAYDTSWAADFRALLPTVLANHFPLEDGGAFQAELDRLEKLLSGDF